MRPGATLVGVALLACGGVEALLLAPPGAAAGPVAPRLLFALMVAAPFALGTALLFSALVAAWERPPFAGFLRDAYEALKARAHGSPTVFAYVALGAGLALTTVAALAVLIAWVLVSSIHTPSYAASAVLMTTVVLFAFGVALTPLAARAAAPAAGLLERGSRSKRLRQLLLVAMLVAVIAAPSFALLQSDAMSALLFERAWGPIASVVFLAAAWIVRRRRYTSRTPAGSSPMTSHLAFALFGAASLVGLLAPAFFAAARRDISQRPSTLRLMLSALDRLTDFDGDGTSGSYAGGDCAAFDASRGPHVLDAPNDGIDQDCSGFDVQYDPATVKLGRSRHDLRSPSLGHKPNILLVTTDGLSFRHTSLGNYSRPVTPQLAAFASRAVTFENAFSTAAATGNAFPSLFTGRWPVESPGLLPPYNRLPGMEGRAQPVLAELLRADGYETVAIVGTPDLSLAAWPELFRGFGSVDESALALRPLRRHSAGHVTARAVDVLQRHRVQPLFLWIHYYDHHAPYQVPTGEPMFGDGETELDRYDTALRFADRSWGTLFAAAEAAWRPSESIIVFTADHGDAFDHHHPRGHHDESLRSEETHVPLIVQGPVQRGTRRRGLATHLDLAPTLLDLAGVPAPPDLRGESLSPVVLSDAEPEKSVAMAMLWQPKGGPIGAPALRALSIRTADLVLLDDRERGSISLFAWPDDPLEDVNLIVPRGKDAEWMRHVLALELGALVPK